MAADCPPRHPLLFYGDRRLRLPCRTVQPGAPELVSLADRLWHTLQERGGIGLAAPQLGSHERLFVVVDARRRRSRRRLVLTNPRLISASSSLARFEEGCLSFPGLFVDLARPDSITVRYHDLQGIARMLETDGLLARAILHELDHLDGILFIDHLSRIRRWLALLRYRCSTAGRRASAA